MDPDTLEMRGYRKDGFARSHGKLVPLTVNKKAPFAQQIALLRAVFPDLREAPPSNQNVASMRGWDWLAPRVDYGAGPASHSGRTYSSAQLEGLADASSNAEHADFEDSLWPEPQPTRANSRDRSHQHRAPDHVEPEREETPACVMMPACEGLLSPL